MFRPGLNKRYIALFVLARLACAQDIPDPYRWLEDGNSPQVKAWADKQNQRTEAYLAKIPGREKLTARLHELYYVDSFSLPKQAGARLFYKRTQATREQPTFYWRSTGRPEAEHLWLDPGSVPEGIHQSVGDWLPSPDGALVAYTTHPDGADDAILHVRDIERGQNDLNDRIRGANFADVSWTPDSQGFYYMRLPMDPTIHQAERVGSGDIRYHKIGQNSSTDALIYPPTHDASQYLTPKVSTDGRWLFVVKARGWTSNDIYYIERGGPTVRFKPLFTSTAAVADVVEWKDRFYLHTNQAAPFGKVLKKKPQEERWETVIPQRPNITIESMHVMGGYLVLTVLQNAANVIEVYRLDGKPLWHVPIPDNGKVWNVSGREDQEDFFIEFESFFVPSRIYRANIPQKKLEIWEETRIPVDLSRYSSDLVWYPSKDGTQVSMVILHRKDLSRNGASPLLLEGYGGFNTPILPRFSEQVLVWLENGGIYAVPHLRGGGEYGEAWHQAGMLTRKQNTFDDFVAAAQFLIKEGYTKPEQLAIQGASNGGLLVTAVLTQRPELFRAAICKNPLTDMIRYPLFGEGMAWVPEYGSPDKQDERAALLAYSPYHHVTKGTAYPSLLMFAGEHDDRVDPMHARKFVAALQSGNTSKNPILFRLLAHSGHSGSDRLSIQTLETADRLSFLIKELDLPSR